MARSIGIRAALSPLTRSALTWSFQNLSPTAFFGLLLVADQNGRSICNTGVIISDIAR